MGKRFVMGLGKAGRKMTGFFNSSIGQTMTLPFRFIPGTSQAIAGVEIAGRAMQELFDDPYAYPPSINDIMPQKYFDKISSQYTNINDMDVKKQAQNTSSQQRFIQSSTPANDSNRAIQMNRPETTGSTATVPANDIVNPAEMYSPENARAKWEVQNPGKILKSNSKFYTQSKALRDVQMEARSPMTSIAPQSLGFMGQDGLEIGQSRLVQL
jgi:hypothetical protein